jgi:hypothetical protein
MKLSPDGGNHGRRIAHKVIVVPAVGSGEICFWRESGVRRSVLLWCVWEVYGFNRREDVTTYNLLYKETLQNVLLLMGFTKIMLRELY